MIVQLMADKPFDATDWEDGDRVTAEEFLNPHAELGHWPADELNLRMDNGDPVIEDPQSNEVIMRWDRGEGEWVFDSIRSETLSTYEAIIKGTTEVQSDIEDETGLTIFDRAAQVVRNLEEHAADHSAGGPDELDATGLQVDGSTTDAHADRHEQGAPDELDASDLSGAAGEDGQVLTTDGTSASWEVAGGVSDEDVAEIALAYDFIRV